MADRPQLTSITGYQGNLILHMENLPAETLRSLGYRVTIKRS